MNLHQFRQILVTTVLLPLVLLLLLALVLAWQFQRTLREQRRIDHTDRITALLNELERLVVDQETGLRDYQLTHDASTLEPYQSAEGALHGTLDRRLLVWYILTNLCGYARSVTAMRHGWGLPVRHWITCARKMFGDTALDLRGPIDGRR